MATIYAIENVDNGKHYIGCTGGKVQKRWREHRCLLRAGKHQCKALQTDWLGWNEKAFQIVILGWVYSDVVAEKRAAELLAMERFAEIGKLYNEHRISFQPPPGFHDKAIAARKANGWKNSPESNLKRRLAQLGIPKGHGAKISATKQARKNK